MIVEQREASHAQDTITWFEACDLRPDGVNYSCCVVCSAVMSVLIYDTRTDVESTSKSVIEAKR